MFHFEDGWLHLARWIGHRCGDIGEYGHTKVMHRWQTRDGKIQIDIEKKGRTPHHLNIYVSSDTSRLANPPTWGDFRQNARGHTTNHQPTIAHGPHWLFHVESKTELDEVLAYLNRRLEGKYGLGKLQHAMTNNPAVDPSKLPAILSELQHVPMPGARDADTQYVPTDEDSREIANRQIKVRRGQQEFRNALLDCYGSMCMITGCRLVHVIEAAHICPYRGEPDNDVQNGLLLRSDIHTLFDLGLLGIDPDTLHVKMHGHLKHEYGRYMDKPLQFECEARPSVSSLKRRWKDYILKLERS